ncbi:MAG: hypothetical protein SH847_26100 [Roseiflexaceae bacterium]|nr:hypothetical protein [Roseiflexaceae bacterium]
MNTPQDDLELAWSRVLHVYANAQNRTDLFEKAIQDFLETSGDHVHILRKALASPGVRRKAALKSVERLDEAEQKQLLGDLVFLASWAHGSTVFVRQIIADYLREWAKMNVEQFAEPILQQGDEEGYRRILELYRDLDLNMMLRLAKRALQHDNLLIQEIGKEFLE